jgi:hypothetical protein
MAMNWIEFFSGLQWLMALLFILGSILIVVELMMPGFGIAGALGIISLLAGVLVASQIVSSATLMGIIVVVLLVIVGTLVWIYRSATKGGRVSRTLLLHSKMDNKEGYTSVRPPLRLEIGPKDIQKNQVVLVRRDNFEKIFVPMDNLVQTIQDILADIHKGLFNRALKMQEERTYIVHNVQELKHAIDVDKGFAKAMWCGVRECEDSIKDETGATTRCIPFKQEHFGDECFYCHRPAKYMAYFGKAY